MLVLVAGFSATGSEELQPLIPAPDIRTAAQVTKERWVRRRVFIFGSLHLGSTGEAVDRGRKGRRGRQLEWTHEHRDNSLLKQLHYAVDARPCRGFAAAAWLRLECLRGAARLRAAKPRRAR